MIQHVFSQLFVFIAIFIFSLQLCFCSLFFCLFVYWVEGKQVKALCSIVISQKCFLRTLFWPFEDWNSVIQNISSL